MTEENNQVDIYKDDDLKFITNVYGGVIEEYLDTLNFTAAFFPESEMFADEVNASNNPYIKLNNTRFSFLQDFSFDQENMLSDLNFCKVNGMNFIKIITPFTRTRSYDFIIARFDESKKVIKALNDNKNKSYTKTTPPHIIGLPMDEIERKTIDFLLDENLRNFCNERDIPLKRGVVFEGPAGTGKCCHKDVKVKVRMKKEDYDALQKNRKEM